MKKYNSKNSDSKRESGSKRDTGPKRDGQKSKFDPKRKKEGDSRYSKSDTRSQDDFKKKSSWKENSTLKNSKDGKKENEIIGDEADYRSVYKGRGKNQKPIFDKVHKSELEKDNRPKRRFKNPFENEESIEKPNYNFEKIEKERNKNPSDETRLNKYIANSGVCSRREADNLIAKGFVTVNGEVITELGYKVKSGEKVTYKGKLLNPEKPVYILLNKPKDFITTTDDPMERKTVMNLIENACDERVFPVGRLDRNTTGLLLFTNDGELAAKLSHPSNQVKKIYQVSLDKPLTQNDEKAILEGLTLEDGAVTVDDMQVLSKDRTILGLEIHVGRNRIVRRIFAHLGYDVIALDRVLYAGLDKKDLPRGRYRFLAEKEVVRLKFFS
ncbi:pseudouridine synthase [Mongoliibacter ruber]|uniref:Pseudouridine synthase n=1 Tax=Mongoliibacter ruber TaxID=1750599 RepID=A0A2T0WS90_9BACT|nr:pseudouridine synthase [Mongoliibacter ruber]PRY89569.1 23S rRNA pseudouridine2605 synthase [Mongoliibacter ruber]